MKLIGFFAEDTAQNLLQYFYFEKYQMDGDVIIIVKFIIGILVTAKSLLTFLLAYKDVTDKRMNLLGWSVAIVYLLMTITPARVFVLRFFHFLLKKN